MKINKVQYTLPDKKINKVQYTLPDKKINKVQYTLPDKFTEPKTKNYNKLILRNIDKKSNYNFISSDNIKYIKTNIKNIKQLECTWKEVLKIEIDQKLDFTPGDSIGLLCSNNKNLVIQILNILEIEGNTNVFIKQIGRNGFEYEGSLYNFFLNVYDFTSLPKKTWLLDLAKKSEKSRDLHYLCSKEGIKDYLGIIKNWNNTIDIIKTFKCKPSLEDILMNCQTLKPRYFSLTNFKNENCEILIGTVKKDERYGHVSDFVKNNQNRNLQICHRESILFRLSEYPKILCIATGTGVAPFLAFLKNKKKDQIIKLIYGFRNEEDDLTKGIELDENSEIIKVLSSNKKYVTDYILEKIKIEDFLIYACGRPEMQKKVYEIFLELHPEVIKNKKIFFDSWL